MYILIKRVKKLLKLLVLLCLIVLALCGIGISGAVPIFSQNRERYIDNGIKAEQVDVKDEDGDETK